MPRPLSVSPLFAARRRALAVLGCVLCGTVTSAPRAQKSLRPTPSQTEGPFYPRTIPADRDADLTQVAGQGTPAQGTRLYFAGRVVTRDGIAHAGATIELWQCDVFGRYHHAGDEGSPRDDGFQGYGVATTDADGRYAFKTIRPVAYGGRVPHLHLKLRTARGATLTTQVYIEGDAADRDPVLAWSPKGTREQLTMALAAALGREAGALSGNFDIVLP
ncbi:MAG: intradiol ring-cleavage dioxygenase [Casimicrobiaceae bacterium]